MDKDLESRFDTAMLEIYRRAKSEAHHTLGRFLQMLTEHRGLETAKILLHADAPSDGYTALWERGRLDLTVEALIHDHPEFHCLFTRDELAKATRRLIDYRYPPAIDPVEPFLGAFAGNAADWAEEHDRYLSIR